MISWKMLTKRLDLVVSSSLSMVLKHYETDHGMVYKMALPDPETINPYRTGLQRFHLRADLSNFGKERAGSKPM